MRNRVYIGRVLVKTAFKFDVWLLVGLSLIVNNITYHQHNFLLLLNN